MKKIALPIDQETLVGLRAGDEVFLSGKIISARDQAHKRMVDLLSTGNRLHFSLTGEFIYYMGPTPAPPGLPIGSAGPTTSSRMDPFTPYLLDHGIKGMIGKGPRSKEVIAAINRNNAVYFYAFGGCGALYADKIEEAELLAFPDLGPEAVYSLVVKDFPVIVAIDSQGNSLY